MSNEPNDKRLTYEPPRAMRVGDTHAGAGACVDPGSGDPNCDRTGNTATQACRTPGNSASGGGGCGFPGNTAEGTCEGPGTGFVDYP